MLTFPRPRPPRFRRLPLCRCMQIGMLIGFATTYPVNWWLIRRGIKGIM
jgi:hypothetical protein